MLFRGRILGLLFAAVVAVTPVTACADDSSAPGSDEPNGPGFPLSLQHRFGTTEIDQRPQRVVAAGFNDADFALALDVVPLGVRDFIGPYPEQNRPWARDRLAGATPEIVGAEEINFEAIAALNPDLILHYSYLEEDDYSRLSQIAPTVVEPEQGSDWREQTLITGRALGRPAQARDLVDQVDAQFDRARSEHPEFAGKTAAVLFGEPASSTGYFLLEPTDPRWAFFADLGLNPPAQTGSISRERVDLLNQDLLLFVGTGPDILDSEPALRDLPVVRDNRTVFLGSFDTDFGGALGFTSPLSLPHALTTAVPRLAAAADGDPTTIAETG